MRYNPPPRISLYVTSPDLTRIPATNAKPIFYVPDSYSTKNTDEYAVIPRYCSNIKVYTPPPSPLRRRGLVFAYTGPLAHQAALGGGLSLFIKGYFVL